MKKQCVQYQYPTVTVRKHTRHRAALTNKKCDLQVCIYQGEEQLP